MITNKDFNTCYEYIISEEYDKSNITTFLKREYDYSVRCINQIKKEGQLLVNSVPSYFSKEIKAGDKISVYFPIEFSHIKPIKLSIDIVYEDEDLLLVNKSPFMTTHLTSKHQEDTLENALMYEFKSRGENIKVRFVSRLDMNTSGLVIVAKNKYVHHFIQNQNSLGNIEKKYFAVCSGVPEKDGGTINKPIRLSPEDNIKREVCEDGEGQNALTGYKVVKKMGDSSLIELELFTGRTHQIRVHLASIGCPVIGDDLYNKVKSDLINRQALHAYYVSFIHPRSREKLEFQISLPKDMKKLII